MAWAVVQGRARRRACRVSSSAASCPCRCACTLGRRPPRDRCGRDRVPDDHDIRGRGRDRVLGGRGQDAVLRIIALNSMTEIQRADLWAHIELGARSPADLVSSLVERGPVSSRIPRRVPPAALVVAAVVNGVIAVVSGPGWPRDGPWRSLVEWSSWRSARPLRWSVRPARS